jgi:hypothetical protein
LYLYVLDASTSTTSTTGWQDKGFDPTGWELALVTAPSNTNSSAADSQLVSFSALVILFFSEDFYPIDFFFLQIFFLLILLGCWPSLLVAMVKSPCGYP